MKGVETTTETQTSDTIPVRKVELSRELCIFLPKHAGCEFIGSACRPLQECALGLTVQHQSIVFSYRSASQENHEQTFNVASSVQTLHLQLRQELLLHLTHDREGGKCPGRW